MSFETELAQVRAELAAGSGYIETAGTGAKVVGRDQIRVPGPSETGDKVVWALPCVANILVGAFAAGAVANLVFTPNRNISVVDVFIDAWNAAAAVADDPLKRAAIQVTNITIQGRPQLAGPGFMPISIFSPLNPFRFNWVFENCIAGQNVVVTLQNNDATIAYNVTGACIVTTVK